MYTITKFQSNKACTKQVTKISSYKLLFQIAMSGTLRRSIDDWRLILLSLFHQLVSHDLHLVLSLIPSFAGFWTALSKILVWHLWSLKKLLVGAFSFVTDVSMTHNFIPSLFSKFFIYHWNLDKETEIKPWMLMCSLALNCMKLLEYCMHCWILSTYDKYQQRLSRLSARKHALATGHRISKNLEKHLEGKHDN